MFTHIDGQTQNSGDMEIEGRSLKQVHFINASYSSETANTRVTSDIISVNQTHFDQDTITVKMCLFSRATYELRPCTSSRRDRKRNCAIE